MKLGIVGLPNVGKSTLFNSLTKAGAESANYPFCTIDPNVGIVTVPDARVDYLAEKYHSKKVIPAAIEFVDIAGLVKGASKGEGLGNQFLANIREVDAIVHVVRCFDDGNIVHVDGSVNPLRDIETINFELIFSDIEGLFTANPFEDATATLIPEVSSITPDIMALASGSSSTVGSGGMTTKIRAARVLMAAGIDMVICQGHNSDFLIQLAEGQSLGTRFSPCGTVHDITPKKLWIALGDTAKGSLIVDEGAAEALVSRGSSLLAVGVCGVEGSFAREDIVDIVNTSGHIIARGKAGASSSEITLACGRSQREIKGNELLRDLAQRPVVHRDELVVFE